MSDFPRDEFLVTLLKFIIRYSVLTSSRKVAMERPYDTVRGKGGTNSVMFVESCCFANPLALIRGDTALVDTKAP